MKETDPTNTTYSSEQFRLATLDIQVQVRYCSLTNGNFSLSAQLTLFCLYLRRLFKFNRSCFGPNVISAYVLIFVFQHIPTESFLPSGDLLIRAFRSLKLVCFPRTASRDKPLERWDGTGLAALVELGVSLLALSSHFESF